jgi:hypothetical protein
MAQGEPAPGTPERGGVLSIVGVYRFEVFFYATGVRIFGQDAKGAPLDASRLTGTATFYHPNSPDPWFVRSLRPAPVGLGQASESLDLVIRLRTVPATGAKVAFDIYGLPAPAQSGAGFTVPVEFVETVLARTAQEQVSRGGHTRELYPLLPGRSEWWDRPYTPAKKRRFRPDAEGFGPRALGGSGLSVFGGRNAVPGSPGGRGIAPSFASPGAAGGTSLIGRPGGVLIVPK